ncbi:MAG: LuxR C-terminal-related transcriptional regulator [Gammaproteobacteria bacterium]|nr:LuxR C-terminal-related transcriptional regulator [Gammaproteobacteria bacterium]MBU1444465.1 LuxR C-terminal-related transcriptional regulator [Gammaproteobacteria bacterium]MBU2289047.1 LuxR C-terminal-related transcriptional regulator [Gammaproteobacteria bacterium]
MNPMSFQPFVQPAADREDGVPAPDALQAVLLSRVLDEIDHGLILVDLTGRILHANYAARRELATGRALVNADGMLGTREASAQARIQRALKDAESDCRSIVEVDHPSEPLSLAFIPMAVLHGSRSIDTVLIMCSRRAGCETVTMQMFARAKRLTPAEQAVLSQLCAGRRAEQIAGLQGVCLSTVRTHIKNVRQKTGRSSIRELVHHVSRMPQIVSALRLVQPD